MICFPAQIPIPAFGTLEQKPESLEELYCDDLRQSFVKENYEL